MTNTICKQCANTFTTKTSYLKRNQGLFCSRSCAAVYNNNNRAYSLICVHCKNSYTSKNKKSKYCSTLCGKLYKELTIGKKVYNKDTLNKKIKILLNSNFIEFNCFECGWDLDIPDVHHIVSRSNGGTDDISNLTCLCPNHHRLADRGKLLNLTSVSERIGLSHHPE